MKLLNIVSSCKQGSNLLPWILVQIILNLDDFLFWREHFLLRKEKKIEKKFE